MLASVFICLRLKPRWEIFPAFPPTTAWKHHMNERHYAPSDPSNTNRRIQMLPPFSLMEQKTRGDCIIHFTPSRVLRFLPSAPSENMRCSAIYHHRFSFSRMLLLKLCDSVPGKKKKKDVRGSSTRVNNYEACSVCVWVWISFTERAFHIVARTLYFQTPAVHKRFRGRGSEVKPPRACSDTMML